MNMQGDLWWRYVWRQVLAWILLITVLTPLLWVTGLLSSASLPAFIGGSALASVACIVAGSSQARSHGAALGEVYDALSHVEKGGLISH